MQRIDNIGSGYYQYIAYGSCFYRLLYMEPNDDRNTEEDTDNQSNVEHTDDLNTEEENTTKMESPPPKRNVNAMSKSTRVVIMAVAALHLWILVSGLIYMISTPSDIYEMYPWLPLAFIISLIATVCCDISLCIYECICCKKPD